MSEGERIARAMGTHDVAFLGNHGVIVAGSTLAYAYDDLYFLERAAQQEVLARSTGLPLRPIVDLQLARRTAEQIQGERVQSDLFLRPFADCCRTRAHEGWLLLAGSRRDCSRRPASEPD